MKRKKVVFMLTNTGMWNLFEGLYHKFNDSNDFEPVVFLCGNVINHVWLSYPNEMPKEIADSDDRHIFTHDFKTMQLFAENNKLNYISGYNERLKKWNSIHSIEPEMIFYHDPADHYYLQEDWKPKNASLNYKTIYLHYGYLVIDRTENFYKLPIFQNAWRVFIESDIHKKIAEKDNQKEMSNFISLGYTKFDKYIECSKSSLATANNSTYSKMIIYAPHWTVSNKSNRYFSRYGTFMDSYKEIVKLMKKHKDIHWIVRPHPLLFSQIEFNFGKEKLQEVIKEFEVLENVEFNSDYDYINLFIKSDGLILDSNSFLAEYMPTQNPIIYIDKGEDLMLNSIGKELLKGCYVTRVNGNLDNIFDDVIIQKKDKLKEIRKLLTNKYLISDFETTTPSEKIFQYIIDEIK